ncbi:MAG TPA: hypothetical protein VFY84_19235 [Jiangellales bacterium]|nr:hypothetical protein [Jiangellales bacterium]
MMERLFKDMSLPGALVIVAAFGTVVALVWGAGVDLVQLAAFIGSVAGVYLAWLAAQQRRDTQEVKTQVNGNNQRLNDALVAALESKNQQSMQLSWVLSQVAASLPQGQPLPAALAGEAPIVPVALPTSAPPVPAPAPPADPINAVPAAP